jgi:hypothetical protein
MKSFREAFDKAHEADLIDHFRQLPRAGRTYVGRGFGIGRSDRCSGLVRLARTSEHDGQRAVLRSEAPPGNWAIEEME